MIKTLRFTKKKLEQEIFINKENPYLKILKISFYDLNDQPVKAPLTSNFQLTLKGCTGSDRLIKNLQNSSFSINQNADNEILVKESEYLLENFDLKNTDKFLLEFKDIQPFDIDYKIILTYEINSYINDYESKNSFETHLKDFRNNKVIFSAKFGKGKSTFLKYFFDSYHVEYEVFKVFPVNYSVSSNEDIFRYIKTDLLIQMMEKDVEFDKKDFSHSLTAQQYIAENPNQIIKTIVKTFLSLNKSTENLVSVLNALKKVVGDYINYRNEVNSNDEVKAKEYINELFEKEGSLYDDNFYTQLIRELVEQIKEKSQKKTVLLIDDLDRMDPDHIFRILNVVSAHCDSYNIEDNDFSNKFGFDKIILVCDIQNIKHIFEHRYGKKVDFGGYINKFYSTEIFEFNNRIAARDFIISLEKKQNINYPIIYRLLQILNKCEAISFRQLIKTGQLLGLNTPAEEFSNYHNYSRCFREAVFFHILKILENVYTTKQELLNVVENCSKPERISSNSNIQSISDYLIPALSSTLRF